MFTPTIYLNSSVFRRRFNSPHRSEAEELGEPQSYRTMQAMKEKAGEAHGASMQHI